MDLVEQQRPLPLRYRHASRPPRSALSNTVDGRPRRRTTDGWVVPPPPLCSHVISSVLSGLLSLLPGFARLHAKYAPRMSFAFPGALGRTPSLFDTDAPFPRTTTMTNRYCNGRRRAQKTWVLSVSVGRKGASDACASSRKVVVVVWDMVGGRWSPSTLVLCATLQSQVCLIQGVACRPFSGSRSTRVVIISHAHVCCTRSQSLE